jgi:hypothetical protein
MIVCGITTSFSPFALFKPKLRQKGAEAGSPFSVCWPKLVVASLAAFAEAHCPIVKVRRTNMTTKDQSEMMVTMLDAGWTLAAIAAHFGI